MTEATLNTEAETVENTTADTEETSVDATPEVFVFVPLFKSIYDNAGKKMISYKPGYIKKDTKEQGTFPVGLGDYDRVEENGYVKEDYMRKFWLGVSVRDEAPQGEEGSLLVTLNEVDTKDYKKIVLLKKVTDKGVSFGVDKPVEVAGQLYWVNLRQNKNADKPQELNLIFNEAQGGGQVSGSEKEVSFDDMDF